MFSCQHQNSRQSVQTIVTLSLAASNTLQLTFYLSPQPATKQQVIYFVYYLSTKLQLFSTTMNSLSCPSSVHGKYFFLTSCTALAFCITIITTLQCPVSVSSLQSSRGTSRVTLSNIFHLLYDHILNNFCFTSVSSTPTVTSTCFILIVPRLPAL